MNLQSISSNFLKYGLVSFPLLLVVGPLIAEIYLITIVIFFSIKMIKEKNLIFYRNRFLIFFILFFISTIYSTLSNFYNLESTIGAIFYF